MLYTQPQSGPALVDFSNPLVPRGALVFTPAQGKAQRIGNPTIGVVKSGLAFQTPSPGNYWQAAPLSVLSVSDVFSFGVVFETTLGSTAGGYALFGERSGGGVDILKIVFGEASIADNGINVVIRNNAGTLVRLISTAAVNDGKPHVILVVKRAANDWNLFVDGVKSATSTASLPGSGFTDVMPLLICYDIQDIKATTGVSLAFAMPGYAYSDSAAIELSRNPWQLFVDDDEEDDALWNATATSGGATYSYTASGGFVMSGSATKVRGAVRTSVGGTQMGGAAGVARGAVKGAAGGFLFSGAATQSRRAARNGSGGITLGGAASMLRGGARNATGGLLLAGHASATFFSAVQSRVVNPVGGLVIAGAAAVARSVRFVAAGGIQLAGHAVAQFGPLPAFIGSLLPEFIRRRRR